MSTTIKETISVSAPIGRAFAYTADFSNIDQWDPGVATSSKRGDSAIGEGTEFDLDVVFGRSRIPMVYTITEFDPPNRVVLTGRGEKLLAIDTIEFVAVDGGTRIDYTAELEFSNFVRFVERFMGRIFDQVGRKAVAGLKAQLDAG